MMQELSTGRICGFANAEGGVLVIGSDGLCSANPASGQL